MAFKYSTEYISLIHLTRCWSFGCHYFPASKASLILSSFNICRNFISLWFSFSQCSVTGDSLTWNTSMEVAMLQLSKSTPANLAHNKLLPQCLHYCCNMVGNLTLTLVTMQIRPGCTSREMECHSFHTFRRLWTLWNFVHGKFLACNSAWLIGFVFSEGNIQWQTLQYENVRFHLLLCVGM